MNPEFKIRRFIALASFASVILIAIAILFMISLGGVDISAKITSASGILIVIITALIGNFGHYSHQVHTHKAKEGTANDD